MMSNQAYKIVSRVKNKDQFAGLRQALMQLKGVKKNLLSSGEVLLSMRISAMVAEIEVIAANVEIDNE